MAVLPILTGEKNPVLRAKTKKIPRITKGILKLLKDMEETAQSSNGAGLAATQIGRSERICIARIGQKLTALINPEIPWISTTLESAEEGCLSLPDIWLYIPRPSEVILRYMSLEGKKIELKLSGWDARVVQHEVDHLDGVLIVDYRAVSPKKGQSREKVRRKI